MFKETGRRLLREESEGQFLLSVHREQLLFSTLMSHFESSHLLFRSNGP